jgi:hypothetical protein
LEHHFDRTGIKPTLTIDIKTNLAALKIEPGVLPEEFERNANWQIWQGELKLHFNDDKIHITIKNRSPNVGAWIVESTEAMRFYLVQALPQIFEIGSQSSNRLVSAKMDSEVEMGSYVRRVLLHLADLLDAKIGPA